MAVRREVLFAVSGFDEAFLFDFEDSDLCLRAQEAGLRVVYEPRSVLGHWERGSVGDLNSEVAQWFDAGRRSFEQRWQAKLRHLAAQDFMKSYPLQSGQ